MTQHSAENSVPLQRATTSGGPSPATLAAREAIAKTLRIGFETPAFQKERRALEHLAECGFAPANASAAAILCTFGQSSDPVAKSWLAGIKADSDRRRVDEFAREFFSLNPGDRKVQLENLASETRLLPLQSRLTALEAGVAIDDDGPADMESEVALVKNVFLTKPTERFRVTQGHSLCRSRWSELRHRWRAGRAILRITWGPPDWIRPTGIPSSLNKPSSTQVAQKKRKKDNSGWIIVFVILGIIRLLSAIVRDSP